MGSAVTHVSASYPEDLISLQEYPINFDLLLDSAEQRVKSWHYRRTKRLIDILGSLSLIAVASVPCLLIAAAITTTSRGPLFYREWRVGRGGKPFSIWKFRSMHAERPGKAGSQAGFKTDAAQDNLLHWRIQKPHGDPRLTPIGGFLRRWSLDELPQLMNVLAGEMSLIGPRPVVEAEIVLYAHLRHLYLAAAPGISGLWQVSGRSDISFPQRVDLDASYVLNWSLRSDFSILVKTVPAVLGRVGAR